MRAYFELKDILDAQGVIQRFESAEGRDRGLALNLYYVFIAQYALESVKNVITKGIGDGFRTFCPPNPRHVLHQMRNVWPEEDMLALRMYCSIHEIEQEINFTRVLDVVNSMQTQAGITREAAALQTKVTLNMNEIGNAVICVEC